VKSEVTDNTVNGNLPKRISPKLLISFVVIGIVLAITAILINASVWHSRLSSEVHVNASLDEFYSHGYSISFDTATENDVIFSSSVVSGDHHSFYVSSNDLLVGSNTLYYQVIRDDHSRLDSIMIENTYEQITLETTQALNRLSCTTELTVRTDPGNRLMYMDVDTVLADGVYSVYYDPDSVLEGYDPDLTPTLVLSEDVTVTNESGNSRRVTEDLIFRFPRVELEITEPWGCYISKTGSGYTIRGTGERGTRVNFYGSATGYATIGWSESFSKWVSVPEFGENQYLLVASMEGFTSDTVVVTINREMTEDEVIREYKNSCEHMTAEYLRNNQSYLVGDRVRVWGRTIEWFSGSRLHLADGDDHWIANLSGFDRVPTLQGLSFYGWGEVTSQYESFYTSGGNSVTAPVVDLVYFEVSY